MCGLAGIISTEKTAFNINQFNILGTLNDERGGDSCGIFIDGKVEYGIGNRSVFRNFTIDVDYPKQASIALLHCRKASPGYPVNIKQAQPVIIKNNDKIEFVLMHNGTITNIKELATKYIPKVNTFDMSDSQILAEIIYKHGYDVLEEYTGCAVLVMVDYRSKTPQILMFKGSSCYNEVKTNSERPLMYMVDQGKFYFSSMYCSLLCINNKKVIYDFPVNQLCQVKDNKLYCIKEIDRTKLKKYQYPNNTIYLESYNSRSITNTLCYDKSIGLYMINNEPAHGIYQAYPSGYIASSDNASAAYYSRIFYFFEGRLLYNKECYNFLENLADLFDEDTISAYCPEIIDYLAYSPRKINGELITVDEDFNYIPYRNGSYVTLFAASDKIQVKDGKCTIVYISATSALDIFQDVARRTFFDFEELERQATQFINSRFINQNAI